MPKGRLKPFPCIPFRRLVCYSVCNETGKRVAFCTKYSTIKSTHIHMDMWFERGRRDKNSEIEYEADK